LRENFDRFNFAFHKEKEMVDFRRCFLAIAVLVLAIGFVAPASAQVATFQCVANAAVPPTIRAEGLTELIGDIVLNCSGGVPTATGTIPTADVTVFLPNAITSRITQAGSPPLVDALLLIDEPSLANQKVCPYPTNPAPLGATPASTNCLDAADAGASFATNGDYNVYQGILTGPNAVTFLGVPVDPPATSGAPSRVYRVTNIRTNASAYVTSSVTPVQGYVSISSSTSIPITNANPIVGFIAPGLVYGTNHAIPTTAGSTIGFLQCESYDETPVQTVTFTEGFATSFKIRDAGPYSGTQTTPGAIYNTESGLIVLDTVPGAAGSTYFGLADLGTRLKITFAGLPHGISLSVPTYLSDNATGATAVLVASNNASAGWDAVPDGAGFGGPAQLSSGAITINYASASPNTGSAGVVYEVTAANPNAIDSFSVPISISFTGAPGVPGSPDIGSIASLTGSFAPTPGGGGFTLTTGSVAEPEASAPPDDWTIPRFVDNTVTTNIFSIALCQTTLLFPYTTDYPGFDTGIAISNTSADPLGVNSASPQTGACQVTFYGGVVGSTGAFTNTGANLNGTSGSYSTTAANTFTTGVIGPGQTWAFSLSSIDSTFGTSGFVGFVGYAIATCQFQYAHGYAFVSDYGLRNFAASYLALIIPDIATPRQPVPNICSGLVGAACIPTGEQLVH
jgi:hypothetical protein